MFLKRLYSEPEGLFEPIEFKNGLNLIIAHRPEGVKGGSLNGVGKSTTLDLIDFCLLASYKKNSGNRLVLAKKIISDYDIVLEFEVDGTDYVIKRSANDHNTVTFGPIHGELKDYSVSALSPILCDLIFLPKDYRGKYSNKWLRVLLHFFLKIHKYKATQFVDPIEYMNGPKLREFVYYHLFLLGIDNSLLYKNSSVVSDYKKVETTRDKTLELAQERLDFSDINEKKSELQQIKRDLEKLEKNVSKFELNDNYEDAEEDANKLTRSIKKLWFENISDKKRMRELLEAVGETDTFSQQDATRVSKIYKELSEDLGVAIKKTLEDAIEYRKKLSSSRRSFIQSQIKKLEESIELRSGKIRKLEEKRAEVLSFLTTKEAIKDLSEAYLALNKKRDELSELESFIVSNDNLETEMLEIQQEETKLNLEIKTFVRNLQNNEVKSITDTFLTIYGAIYHNEDRPTFSISDNLGKDSKVEITVKVPAGHSKARNQGRTLVYDLTVMFTMIEKHLRGPKFLIHDGIFDGMDPAHFTELYKFLVLASEKDKFQYIATLNESGPRGALGGELDEEEGISMSRLIDDSVLDLTPNKKLFNRDFDE